MDELIPVNLDNCKSASVNATNYFYGQLKFKSNDDEQFCPIARWMPLLNCITFKHFQRLAPTIFKSSNWTLLSVMLKYNGDLAHYWNQLDYVRFGAQKMEFIRNAKFREIRRIPWTCTLNEETILAQARM